MTVKLIHGDCITGMDKLIQTGTKVDLIITDPPYLMEYKTNVRKNKNHKFCTTIQNDNNTDIIRESVKRCHHLLKEGGHFIAFAPNIKSIFLNKL